MRYILLFVTAIFLSSLNAFAQKDFPVIDLAKEKIAAQELARSGVKVKITGVAEGVNMSESYYMFSDKTPLSLSHGRFKTSAAAREAYEKQLKSAIKIIKPDGSSGDESVLAIYKGKSGYEYRFVQIIPNKNMVGMTYSTSLKHLLAFELIRNE